MDNQLVIKFQNIKAAKIKCDTEKVKAQTELDLKKKELANIVEQFKELGIDPENAENAIQEKTREFEKALNEAQEVLNNVSRA